MRSSAHRVWDSNAVDGAQRFRKFSPALHHGGRQLPLAPLARLQERVQASCARVSSIRTTESMALSQGADSAYSAELTAYANAPAPRRELLKGTRAGNSSALAITFCIRRGVMFGARTLPAKGVLRTSLEPLAKLAVISWSGEQLLHRFR